MSVPLEEMPLFPLNAVLLPYQALPLNVFEERYRKMIQHCLKEDKPFGIVLIREGEEVNDPSAVPYMVGTSARIVNCTNSPEGDLHVLTAGERRFRVRKLDYSKEYLVGLVEPIVELEWNESPDNQSLVARAKDAFRMHLTSLFGAQDVSIKVQFTEDPMAMSFAMAGCIHLTLLQKQHLLELTDTAERFREIIPYMEQQAFDLFAQAPPTALERYEDYISRN